MASTKTPEDQPAWDLSREYASLEDPAFLADLAETRRLLRTIEDQGKGLDACLGRVGELDPLADSSILDLLRGIRITADAILFLWENMSTYASCLISVDGQDAGAKEYRGILAELGARIDVALAPLDQVFARCPEAFLEAFLSSPEVASHRFRIGQARKYRDRLLSLELEGGIARLWVNGPEAWNRLYHGIAGTAVCELHEGHGIRKLGLAQAQALLRQGDRDVRKAAFEALNASYGIHEESLSAILNAISGWRLCECEMRSRTAPYHFLDAALAQNCLSRRSLDAMMAVVDGAKDLGRRALSLQARLLGVDRLACWDLLAPCPSSPDTPASSYRFTEGLDIVRAAFSRIDPDMGAFVSEMASRRNIEARILPNKRPGAYCTAFSKSKEAKVFLSYSGNLGEVSTLAHELGHAWHNRLLDELKPEETHYPMNLAETASTFAETALADYLSDSPGTGLARRRELGWSDAQDAATFLLNVPARFAFEKAFYEARAEKPLGPAALSDLMGQAWDSYYGDSLAGRDPDFWKGKLHFYMSGRSFYNFPYTFGYLFSLGLYARRTLLGGDFPGAYRALLRDTGRMESEELAKKHLGVELGEEDFWQTSIDLIRSKLDRFEALL